MNLLLKEYLVSGEVSEAERCLGHLEVPHFHHELVYEVRISSRSTGKLALELWLLYWDHTGLHQALV